MERLVIRRPDDFHNHFRDGAALARTAAVGIGEAAGIEHHRRQSGRVEAGGGELGMRRV